MNTFFSSEFANKSAIEGNILSLLLYKTAYPTARLCASLSFKPNTLTWMSVFFALLAALSINISKSPIYFIFFWIISFHLDFSDGTLARMTRNESKSAFRLDHMTDLVKLFIVFLSAGIFYNSFTTWILVSSLIFSLMYSEIVTQEIKFYVKLHSVRNKQFSETKISESGLVKTLLGNNSFMLSVLRNAHSIFFSFSGHTLVFFCIIPFGETYANGFLFYLAAVCIYGLIRAIKTLNSLQR